MDLKLDYQEPDKESDILCQEIKNLTTPEPITKKEEIEKWDITAISPSALGQEQKQRPNKLEYKVNERQVQKFKKGIFIEDSAAASHMTSDMTGFYNLLKISGSVMIGNGLNIKCTPKGLLDVICVHKDGSMAKDTWEINVVPQLNHDLFSFTSPMKNGWQMNGRWKKNGIEIELFKRVHDSFRFDRMIPSESSWFMVVKVKRVIGRAHSMIECGRKITIEKLHYMMGHIGRHLINPTAQYLGIQTTGKLNPHEYCARRKIRQANMPKSLKVKKQRTLEKGYSLTSVP